MNGIGLLLILFLFFFFSFTFGVTCAITAESKGRSSGGWFIVGFLSNILGLLFILIAPENQEVLNEKAIEKGTHKKCGYCDEVVKRKAVKCRYCHSTLEIEEPQQKEPDNSQTDNSQQSDRFTTLEDMKK